MTRLAKALLLALFYAVVGATVALGYANQLFPVLTFTATALAWLFVLLYGIRSPWQRTVVGRSLMYVWLALTALLSLVFFSYWLGAYPGRDYVRALLYSSLIPAFLSFVAVLVEQQGKRTPETPPIDADLAKGD